MKPEYKQLYRNLIHNKINSEYESVDQKISKPKNNNVLNYKLNSFLDASSMKRDSQILILNSFLGFIFALFEPLTIEKFLTIKLFDIFIIKLLFSI